MAKRGQLKRARKAAATRKKNIAVRRAVAPDGRPKVLSNAGLALTNVPLSSAGVHDLFHFALSYQGYDEAGHDQCGEIANARRNDTLHALRTCLFFEQRRWHHFGETPDGEDLEYLRSLVERIRGKLLAAGRGGARAAKVPAFDPEVYKRAIDLAGRVHRKQTVPGGKIPYVVHVAKVAMEVIAASEGVPGMDRDLAVACAVLHDTVEDSEPTERPNVIADIHAGFGSDVARGVLALTKADEMKGVKDKAKDKAARMADSLRRIHEQPREVWLVKLADRITNLEPPPAHWSLDKRQRYLAEARTILDALGDASPSLKTRFEQKLAEYERHCQPSDDPGRGR